MKFYNEDSDHKNTHMCVFVMGMTIMELYNSLL